MACVVLQGPELLSKYIGASELAVRDIFTRYVSEQLDYGMHHVLWSIELNKVSKSQ